MSQISGEKHWNWKGLPKPICIDCGGKVSLRRIKRCIKCAAIKRSGENAYQYKGGKPRCSECGTLTTQYTSKMCRKCFLETIKGVNCPLINYIPTAEELNKRREINRKRLLGKTGEESMRWIADRSKLAKRQERGDSAYKDWRKQIWVRDNYKCKMSNKDCCGRIEAHHILGWDKHPELRYAVNNGITLCHFHHPKKRAEEMRLSPYFQNIISLI